MPPGREGSQRTRAWNPAASQASAHTARKGLALNPDTRFSCSPKVLASPGSHILPAKSWRWQKWDTLGLGSPLSLGWHSEQNRPSKTRSPRNGNSQNQNFIVQPQATVGLVRNYPVQGRWELTVIHTGDNYLSWEEKMRSWQDHVHSARHRPNKWNQV